MADLCWICGSAGPMSKEHRHKKSDLRAVFGDVSPGSGIFWHDSAGLKNVRVPSLNARRLKVDAPMCAMCNNTRTQPHDQAWETLSDALRKTLPQRSMPSCVRVRSLIPHETRETLLNVHLFFAKMLGCFIVEEDAPLDHGRLAKAILTGKPHPDLYLRFGLGPFFGAERLTGRSTLQVEVSGGGSLFAAFCYCVTPIAVQVLLTNDPIAQRTRAWHPKLGTTRLEVIDFEKVIKAGAAAKPVHAH